MTEDEIVRNTPGLPATVESLQADLCNVGVAPGTVLLVHSSLSSLGWVCGGSVTVVMALEAALGSEGTLVMPTYSSDLSEPSYWRHPPVPESWWPVIREKMPAFNEKMTPTRDMGAIADCFRTQEGTRRSSHPQCSFAARGKHAEAIVGSHPLDFQMGDDSPLGRVYDLGGWILLLGVGFERASSFHLAEFRADYPGKKEIKQGAPVVSQGKRVWVEFLDFDCDDSDFMTIGASFGESTGLVKTGRVGNASALLFPQRQFVDYAVEWMEKHRK